jgi:hypothetical protein
VSRDGEKTKDRGGYSPVGEIGGEGLVQMVWVLLLKMRELRG